MNTGTFLDYLVDGAANNEVFIPLWPCDKCGIRLGYRWYPLNRKVVLKIACGCSSLPQHGSIQSSFDVLFDCIKKMSSKKDAEMIIKFIKAFNEFKEE